jgi:WD40 repeat protein
MSFHSVLGGRVAFGITLLVYASAPSFANDATSLPAGSNSRAQVPIGALLEPTLQTSFILYGTFGSTPGFDGKILSVGASVMLWGEATGQLLKTIGHSEETEGGTIDGGDHVAFSPDHKWIASGLHNQFLVRNSQTGQRLFGVNTTTEGLSTLMYSPDGYEMLTAGYGAVEVWDAKSGRLIRTIEAHPNTSFASYSPDGRFIAVVNDADTVVNIYRISTGQLVRTIGDPLPSPIEDSGFSQIAFSQDNRFLATTLHESIYVWNIGDDMYDRYIVQDRCNVTAIAFVTSSSNIVTGNAGGDITRWDFIAKKKLASTSSRFGAIYSIDVARDRPRIVSTAGSDFSHGIMQVWTLSDLTLAASYFTVGGKGVAYTPRGIFVTAAQPQEAFTIRYGREKLPLDEFIRLNRRDALGFDD